MGADRERERDERKDQRGERQREALVELDQIGRPPVPVGPELGNPCGELGERQVLLRFLATRRAFQRGVHREAQVVHAEEGVAIAGAGRRAARGHVLRQAPRGTRRHHVGLAHAAVQQAQGDAPVHLVGQEPSLARRDDPGELRVALVRDQQPAQGNLGRAHVLDVDDHVPEGRVEDALLEPARRARLDDLEQLALELAVGHRVHDEREARRDRRDDQGDREHRPEESERTHPHRFERDDLQVAGQTTAGQEDRDQKRHGQGVGEKGRKHVDEELDDKVERHAFRDDQVGQVVDPVDDEEECEEGAAEREGRDELVHDVPVEDERPHRSVVP